MAPVIGIDGKNKTDKPVEFTHVFNTDEGWEVTSILPAQYKKIVYLGKCEHDGDMFEAYVDDCIDIFKGHLNSGNY